VDGGAATQAPFARDGRRDDGWNETTLGSPSPTSSDEENAADDAYGDLPVCRRAQAERPSRAQSNGRPAASRRRGGIVPNAGRLQGKGGVPQGGSSSRALSVSLQPLSSRDGDAQLSNSSAVRASVLPSRGATDRVGGAPSRQSNGPPPSDRAPELRRDASESARVELPGNRADEPVVPFDAPSLPLQPYASWHPSSCAASEREAFPHLTNLL
jgi:hypothetical protein